MSTEIEPADTTPPKLWVRHFGWTCPICGRLTAFGQTHVCSVIDAGRMVSQQDPDRAAAAFQREKDLAQQRELRKKRNHGMGKVHD